MVEPEAASESEVTATSEPPSGRSAAVPILLSVVAFVLVVWPAFMASDRALPNWFSDDAYYYFTIARNVVNGLGLTFDGSHLTNGFHPLWLLVSAGLYAIVPGDDLPLRAVILLQAALIAGAVWLLAAGLRRRVGTRAAAFGTALLLFLPGSLAAITVGMESALVLFLLVSCQRAQSWAEDAPGHGARWTALGVLWALAILARLECAAALAAPCLKVAASHLPWRDRVRRLAGLALPPAATVIVYLGWNLTTFGDLLPISARIKSHWNVLGISPSTLWQKIVDLPWLGQILVRRLLDLPLVSQAPVWLLALYFAGSLAFLVWLITHRRSLLARIRRAEAGVLLASCAIMVAVDYLAQGTAYYNYTWQHTPLHLLNAVFFGVWMAGKRFPGTLVVVAVSAFGLVQLQREAAVAPRSFCWAMSHLAPRIRDSVEEGSKVGSWNAGTLGYYSHRPVVNLDGLVNDRRYFQRVYLDEEFEEYLLDTDIRWIADVACHGRDAPAALAHPLFQVHRCELVPEAQWRFPHEPCFAGLWRLRCIREQETGSAASPGGETPVAAPAAELLQDGMAVIGIVQLE